MLRMTLCEETESKVRPSHMGPWVVIGCKTTDTGLMHHMVCLFTPKLLKVVIALWPRGLN